MPTPSFTRRAARYTLTLGAALAAALLAACADAPTAPGAAARGPARLSEVSAAAPVAVRALVRTTPLARDVETRVVVYATKGATFELPGTGLTVTVPANAFASKSLEFRVRARAGSVVAYEFEPHGTVFRVPLQLSQSYKGTSYETLADRSGVEVGYFASGGDVDEGTKTAQLTELRTPAVDAATARLRFPVSHFSGYMLSSGRSR